MIGILSFLLRINSLVKIDLNLQALLLLHRHFKGLFVIEIVKSMGDELLEISRVLLNRFEHLGNSPVPPIVPQIFKALRVISLRLTSPVETNPITKIPPNGFGFEKD